MPTTYKNQDMAVVIYDLKLQKAVPKSANIRVLKQSQEADIENAKHLFVLSSDVGLGAASAVIRKANNQHRLRALMINSEVDSTWLPQFMNRADVHTLRNTIVHRGAQVPLRVLRAWAEGSQDIVIASATVDDGLLLVQDCAANIHEFPFAANRALAELSSDQRRSFEIDPDGNYIYWPSVDIHLDMDTIKSTLYSDHRERAARERVTRDARFGRAIAMLRKEHGLFQGSVPGLSARQLSRIERGDRASVKAIEHLAEAHQMEINTYLNDVANRMGKIGKEFS